MTGKGEEGVSRMGSGYTDHVQDRRNSHQLLSVHFKDLTDR